MFQFIKKYKAFLIGLLLIVPIFYMLDYIGFLLLPENQTLEIVLYAIFWGIILALPFHYYTYLKEKKKTVFRVLGLVAFFFIALVIDSSMKVPDNPITFSLLIGFWIGLAYVLIPTFIKKYWTLIAFIYTPLFLYFLYLRLFSGDLETYLKIKEELPFFIFFLPIPVLFLVWVFEQWKWVQNLKAEKSKTELSLLRSQINPHFFFNTLNNLYALTIKNSKQAPDVILKLSDMMRYTIYEGEKETVKLGDEIEYLKNYMELHKIRYKKSVDLSFKHDVNPNLQIAPLLFIILLENAFKHGVETLSENAFIHIHLYEDADSIYFNIENNFDSKEMSQTKGIGLANLKRRLSLLYPKKHELNNYIEGTIYKSTLKISKHA
ncbi:sensor histidine kinase [Xanthomarina gelatinilytica]|uniref:sensor histidine kinase n=1 Tax=Xanthomarina gelatinilytica TaxID=1137281 RepID=UPI003AA89B30